MKGRGGMNEDLWQDAIQAFQKMASFAKDNKIKKVSLEGISFEFSELAFLQEPVIVSHETLDENEEDILFHSAGE